MTVYTIYIQGTEKYTDVSEDEFFDIMQELAFDHYETGVPALNDISYRMKEHGETEAISDEQSHHRVETQEDSSGQL